MNIVPYNSYIVVKEIKESTTDSGIVLPDTMESDLKVQAEVLAVGPGSLNEKGERVPVGVSVGQIVLITSYGNDSLKYKGETYKIVSEDSILAIINK